MNNKTSTPEAQHSDLVINYGKDQRENTILIRLHIKAKSKRLKLSKLFLMALENPDNKAHENFVSLFNLSIKSKTHDIVWCKFKWKDDKSWTEVCSDDLFYSLTDVVEDDEYLYLAFDIDRLSKARPFKLDDFIWFIFINLDGVKKVWVQYRPGSHQHLYLYYPGMGDESFFVPTEALGDAEWPKLG